MMFDAEKSGPAQSHANGLDNQNMQLEFQNLQNNR